LTRWAIHASKGFLPFGFETAPVEEFRGSKRCAESRDLRLQASHRCGQRCRRASVIGNRALKAQGQSGDRSTRRIGSRAHRHVCVSGIFAGSQ